MDTTSITIELDNLCPESRDRAAFTSTRSLLMLIERGLAKPTATNAQYRPETSS